MRTYAFIDASNIIYGARAEGWFIDQKKLLKYLKDKFSVSKAFFYYGKDSKSKKKEKFLKKLEQFGYTLRVKEIKKFAGKEHIDFGSLRYFLEYKKEGDPKLESSLSIMHLY